MSHLLHRLGRTWESSGWTGQDRMGQDRTAGGGRQDRTRQERQLKSGHHWETNKRRRKQKEKGSWQCDYGEETAGGESGVPGTAGCQGPGHWVLWKHCQVRERDLRGPQKSSQVHRGPQGSSEFLVRGSPSLLKKLLFQLLAEVLRWQPKADIPLQTSLSYRKF